LILTDKNCASDFNANSKRDWHVSLCCLDLQSAREKLVLKLVELAILYCIFCRDHLKSAHLDSLYRQGIRLRIIGYSAELVLQNAKLMYRQELLMLC